MLDWLSGFSASLRTDKQDPSSMLRLFRLKAVEISRPSPMAPRLHNKDSFQCLTRRNGRAANAINHIRNSMKTSHVRKTTIRIAVIDSDPLRFVGLRALLSAESDFELQSVTLAEIGAQEATDLILLGSHPSKIVIDILTTVKVLHPGVDIIVTGWNLDDAAILMAVSAGAKGCVDDTASAGELVRAIRMVLAGTVWAPRRVLSMFVDQVYLSSKQGISAGQRPFTIREKEVLGMLVAGCSNKEIAAPLGIEERTVKAHIAKLFRKLGVSNRVMLSVHAITHSLVASWLLSESVALLSIVSRMRHCQTPFR